jgi:L-fucono-1,5-lactonase
MIRVIDAHQHVLDPVAAPYPWMTPELDAIRRPFGMGDLAPELAMAGVDATILVQARTSLAETRELLAIAAATPVVTGVVGWADLTDPGLAGVLADLRAGPGGDRLVGIRHPASDEPDPDWLRRDDVARGLATIGRAGLVYDLLIWPREIPAAQAAVRRAPEVRFVVDHLAKPTIAAGRLEPWSSGMRELAASPNTVAKLSGLITEASWDAWAIDDLRPFVDVALDAFGPARLLFGSDWPVCLLAGSYQAVIGAARELTGGLSVSERSAVFGGTAQDVYRLGA